MSTAKPISWNTGSAILTAARSSTFPGAGLIRCARAVDQENPHALAGLVVAALRGENGVARRQPVHGNIIVRIAKPARLAGHRCFS